ncbi:MAG: hypothetical protein AAGA32_01145 [Pseudomonadota bacterium]
MAETFENENEFLHDIFLVHETEKWIYHFRRHGGDDELEEMARPLRLDAKIAVTREERDEVRAKFADNTATSEDEDTLRLLDNRLTRLRLKQELVERYLANGTAVQVIPRDSVIRSTNGTCYVINLAALQPDRRWHDTSHRQKQQDEWRHYLQTGLNESSDDDDKFFFREAMQLLDEAIARDAEELGEG